jgi:peptidoglycan/LPS O-acetylase OafA/YrhL
LNLKQIKGLDTLRAFAVLCVINTHWFPVFFVNKPLLRFIKEVFIPDGATGVYIFFTLSGFLITSILLNARFSSNEPKRLSIIKNFFARRTLRIFPIYYIFLTILLLTNYFPDIKQNIAWFLTYTSNIFCFRANAWNSASHTWTLAVEEQFYICWPWFILFVNKRYLKYVFGAAIITGIISTYWSIEIAHRGEPFLVFNCIDSFAIGGIYAYARLNNEHGQKLEKIIKRIVPVLLITYFYWKLSGFLYYPGYFSFLKKTIESLLALWLITLIINNRSIVIKRYLLENKVLNFIGKISYCIYLVHPYIPLLNHKITLAIGSIFKIPELNKFFTGNIIVYSFDFLILLLVCTASYLFIEKPILNLKRWFKYS